MWHSEIIEISNDSAVINEGVNVFRWHPDNTDEMINSTCILLPSSEHSFSPLPPPQTAVAPPARAGWGVEEAEITVGYFGRATLK